MYVRATYMYIENLALTVTWARQLVHYQPKPKSDGTVAEKVVEGVCCVYA